MFKFDFQLEEEDEDVQIPVQSQAPRNAATSSGSANAASSAELVSERARSLTASEECHHVPLDELIKLLPEEISYSPLYSSFLNTPILRRDLFDARFQLYNRAAPSQGETDKEHGPDASESAKTESNVEEEEGEGEGEEYVDAKTDLIPGLYEGGLKSWEGGVDLVEVLSSIGLSSAAGAEAVAEAGIVDEESERRLGEWVRGGRVLEVGCGTSLPTAYLLRSLLSSPSSSMTGTKTTFHVQDYNSLVLSLVTLPNLILATLPFLPTEALHPPEEEEDVESVLPDLDLPGNLYITPTLLDAFKKILEERGIELLFTYGHWAGLASDLKQGEGYGLVLTAETIYAEESNLPLLDVLKAAVKKGDTKEKTEVAVGLEDSLGDLKVNDDWKSRPLIDGGEGYVLVAAKVLYFGVGGGLQGFLELVKQSQGWSKNVKEWVKGVGRKVVQVGW